MASLRPHEGAAGLSSAAGGLTNRRAAWTRLFDETIAALRFPVDGKSLTSNEVLNLLTDRDGAVRKKAARSLAKNDTA